MYLQKGKTVDRQRRRWKKVKNSRGNTKVREGGEVLCVGVDIPCRLWKTSAGEEEIWERRSSREKLLFPSFFSLLNPQGRWRSLEGSWIGESREERCFFSSLAVCILIGNRLKYFPTSVLLRMVTAKQTPCLYLDTWAFSSFFFLQRPAEDCMSVWMGVWLLAKVHPRAFT